MLWLITRVSLGIVLLLFTACVCALGIAFTLQPPNDRFLDRVGFLLFSTLFGWAACAVWRILIIRHEHFTPQQYRLQLLKKYQAWAGFSALSPESFAATVIPPMRRLVGPDRPDILLDDYLRHCRTVYNPPGADHQFVELRCLISADSRFMHVVYAFGPPESCLIMVLVLDLSENSILGHHFINPPELPADHACPVPKPAPPPHLTHPEAKELPNDE